jgi:hypothetical protein
MSSYRAKENWLKKMNSSEGNQLYLLGTLHGLDENHLLCIKAVVENLKPTIVLVEIRPPEFEKGNYCDGPPEMTYITLIAQKANIEVFGIDWWREELSGAQIASCNWEAMNDEERMGIINSEERNKKIKDNILMNIKSGTKKALVVLGYSHIKPIMILLTKQNWHSEEIPSQEMERYFRTGDEQIVFPGGMSQYIKRGKEVLNDYLIKYGKKDNWSNRVSEKEGYLESILEYVKTHEE